MARIAHVATVDLTHRFLLLPQLVALRDAGHDVTAIGASGPWVPEIEKEGIRYIPWTSVTRAWDPGADLRAFVELVAILRRERFDAVHTHNPKPGAMGRVAARALRTPVVLNTVHGLWTTPEDPLAKRFLVLTAEWLAARCSDLELYQSGEDLAWARRLRIVGAFAVAPPGQRRRPGALHAGRGPDRRRRGSFAPSWGSARTSWSSAPLAGWSGRRASSNCSAPLASSASACRWLGSSCWGRATRTKPDAIAAAEVESAREDVLFTGWRDDVAELMSVMDVFALPSWREGMPRSAIEAAASGLPLVLTDIRGCREVVRDGVEGLLVPVRDPEALADAMTRVLEDPALRSRMGAAARRRAEAEFDQRRVVATVVGETERLLRRRGIGGARGSTVVRRARRADAPRDGPAPSRAPCRRHSCRRWERASSRSSIGSS